MEHHHALLAFGSAVDEKTRVLPDHVFKRLDRTAELYQQVTQAGYEPLVVVSGFQRARHVYKNNLLRDEAGRAVRECDPMADYLRERYGIEVEREGKAASMADNLVFSKLILMSKLAHLAVRQVCIVTLEPLRSRTEALGRKIFGTFAAIRVETIPTEARFPLEAKFFGDHLCMLKAMSNGDHSYILNQTDGSSLWPKLGTAHNATCRYFVPDGESRPFFNYHPDDVMRSMLEALDH